MNLANCLIYIPLFTFEDASELKRLKEKQKNSTLTPEENQNMNALEKQTRANHLKDLKREEQNLKEKERKEELTPEEQNRLNQLEKEIQDHEMDQMRQEIAELKDKRTKGIITPEEETNLKLLEGKLKVNIRNHYFSNIQMASIQILE